MNSLKMNSLEYFKQAHQMLLDGINELEREQSPLADIPQSENLKPEDDIFDQTSTESEVEEILEADTK